MKVLLVSVDSKYIHLNLAVHSLKAYAESSMRLAAEEDSSEADCGEGDIRIETAEYTINQPVRKVLADIYRQDAEIIMFSCYIWNISFVESLLRNLAVIMPAAEIWLGGPEVSFDGERLMSEHGNLRGIMVGEGEATFAQLLEVYAAASDRPSEGGKDLYAGGMIRDTSAVKECGSEESVESGEVFEIAGDRVGEGFEFAGDCVSKDFEAVAGIIFRDERGNMRTTALREPLDMDGLPFPYEDMDRLTGKVMYYETSRGCPFRCSYCLSSVDRKLRFRSMDLVKRDFMRFLDNKVPQVKLVDRTFNCDHGRAAEIWRFLRDNDNGVTNFHFELAADILNQEEMEILNSLRPGQVQLEIGVQTANERTLAAISRKTDLERLCRNTQAIKASNNVHAHLDLIAGLPYEDLESFRNSFNRVFAMRPQQLQLGFLKVLKGSPMAGSCGEYGIRYTAEPPYEVMETRWLSYDDILALKDVEEMVEVYYNTGQFTRSLELLLKMHDSAYDMFAALGRWHAARGLDMVNLSRNSRFESMMSIISERAELMMEKGAAAAGKGEISEAVVLDYYSRDNVKSRPLFLGGETADKAFAKEFYSSEARYHKYLTGEALRNVDDPRILRKHTHLERTSSGYLLMDYTRRDPLTNNAMMIEID